jgi:V/A-type H+-transporting ATPase subunit B
MNFGREFEENFIAQDFSENRNIDDTLDLGWTLLRLLPVSELDRLSPEIIEKYYKDDSEDGDF